MASSSEIRESFLRFFAEREHERVTSGPLVPPNDPTLMFANAGMVQFKDVFTGKEERPYSRATSSQKCIRISGKHNDLENVGVTARHHTFFEMLGNFSFGDYFKRDAIAFAWEFVTSPEWLGIDPARLWVTVHEKDDEALRLWEEVPGLLPGQLFGLGDKDNFWQMGDTGPCGPCSEIYVDIGGAGQRGSGAGGLTRAEFEEQAEAGRFLEIWNLVFMQYDRSADGTLTPLPKPSVDTGAGLERIAAVLQEQDSNFHTDLFLPLLNAVGELVGNPYDRGPAGASYRVLADHARAVSFLLADGVVPSNEGRGYVLRRILRRGVRHAWLLGRREPTLAPLTDIVVREMGDAYPELARHHTRIVDVVRGEEDRFQVTLGRGLVHLEEEVGKLKAPGKGGAVLPGDRRITVTTIQGTESRGMLCSGAELGLTTDADGIMILPPGTQLGAALADVAGDTVLDIGSGAGTDTLIAATLVGASGKVYGLEMTRAMQEKLARNISLMAIDHVEVVPGNAEEIPLPDASVDVITSNGVINLVPDKPAAIREMFRVLRPGGRVQITDIVIGVNEDALAESRSNPRLWAECIVGAVTTDGYYDMFEAAGFARPQTLKSFDYFSKSSVK